MAVQRPIGGDLCQALQNHYNVSALSTSFPLKIRAVREAHTPGKAQLFNESFFTFPTTTLSFIPIANQFTVCPSFVSDPTISIVQCSVSSVTLRSIFLSNRAIFGAP